MTGVATKVGLRVRQKLSRCFRTRCDARQSAHRACAVGDVRRCERARRQERRWSEGPRNRSQERKQQWWDEGGGHPGRNVESSLRRDDA